MQSEQTERIKELAPAMQRLDRLIERALHQLQETYAEPGQADPYRGLYISRAEVDRILGNQAFSQAPSIKANPIKEPETTGRVVPFWSRWFLRRSQPLAPEQDLLAEDIPIGDLARPVLPAQAGPSSIPELDLEGTRLGWLGDTYGLSAFDLDVLLVALAPELDLHYERLYAYLQDDVTRKRPTVDLALNLLCTSPEERLVRRSHFEPDAPLIQHGMLHLFSDSAVAHPPLLAHTIQLDPQFVDILLGQNGLDRRLASFCDLIEPAYTLADLLLDEETRQALPALVAESKEAQRPLTVYFEGPPGEEQRRTAEALASESEVNLLWVHLSMMPASDLGFQPALDLLLREARFQGALLYLDGLDSLQGPEGGLFYQQLMEALAEYRGVTILSGAHPWAPAPRGPLGVIVIPFAIPSFEQRRAIWEYQLASVDISLSPGELDSLAGRFRLTPAQIANAVASAVNLNLWRAATNPPDGEQQIRLPELFAAARQQSGYELAALTHKVKAVYTWRDIVLPEDALAQLHEICQQVAYREVVLEAWGFERKLSQGKGVSALFSGPPGTGKTMAAEVIANELGLDLYKIDLSSVVSKYIGETEQNLERIFKTAENANAILFFDEADVLFSKRSEVRDAHDRYANIEVAYLLQRMEQYEGLAILATNLLQNIDDAFTRRLQFIVTFPFPDEAYRLRIWQVQMPPEAPLAADVDYPRLARQFRIAGGNIKNIALAAAYLAAAEQSAIGMQHLLQATRRELQKIGKIAPESEFSTAVEKSV